jgi:ATP-binding cassette, subfamily B, bacterial
MVSAYAEVSAQTSYVRRLWRFLDGERARPDLPAAPAATVDADGGASPPSGSGSRPVSGSASPKPPAVQLSAVSFTYRDGTTALTDLSFSVGAGEWVAVVGPNGAGKSTLLKVLSGLYPPSSGALEILGGPPTGRRTHLATLWQDFQLFSYSIEDNVRFGRTDLQDGPELRDRARAELSAMGLARFADAEGLATRIGTFDDVGHDLSGGQRQRLALARTAFRGGRLWLLDEPTAALDARDAARLVPALRRRAEGAGGVVVTHHLGMARTLDRILVLDRGCLVEQGTHEQLMTTDGLYRRLYEEQAAAFVEGLGSATASGGAT